MKNLRSLLRAFVSLRLLAVVIITGLIAVSFTATALMQSKKSSSYRQIPNQSGADPSAEFWH